MHPAPALTIWWKFSFCHFLKIVVLNHLSKYKNMSRYSCNVAAGSFSAAWSIGSCLKILSPRIWIICATYIHFLPDFKDKFAQMIYTMWNNMWMVYMVYGISCGVHSDTSTFKTSMFWILKTSICLWVWRYKCLEVWRYQCLGVWRHQCTMVKLKNGVKSSQLWQIISPLIFIESLWNFAQSCLNSSKIWA